jgi:thymidylate synthase (FAD)
MELHEMPDDVIMIDHMTVKLIRSMAEDDFVVQAAQVSQLGENNAETDPRRLINALMRERHGSPFEHTAFTFFFEMPIFAAREHVRHRMASLNEMSGRYTILPNRFYTYPEDRLLVNNGTSMKPSMGPGTAEQRRIVAEGDWEQAQAGWTAYKRRKLAGISNEVSRSVLPLNIMTQMYWTVNARSLLNYLSLRVQHEAALNATYPQREIEMVGQEVERLFNSRMPLTYTAFLNNGRVAP